MSGFPRRPGERHLSVRVDLRRFFLVFHLRGKLDEMFDRGTAVDPLLIYKIYRMEPVRNLFDRPDGQLVEQRGADRIEA